MSNAYATLQDFKDWKSTTDTDATDDGVISNILAASSRWIDNHLGGRKFYPTIEARLFDVPGENLIFLDSDLCEVLTITNGESSDTLSSSDYTLLSANLYPKWGLKLKDISSLSWNSSSDSSAEQVISVNGIWAYHNEYTTQGWTKAGTLGAAMSDTTTLTLTMTAGHTVTIGNILKIGTELLNVTNISSSDTITVNQRGDNGSTAATHLITTDVYKWNTQADIWQACLEITTAAYGRRKGQGTSGVAQVTGAGVVITPKDIPGGAREAVDVYKRNT